MCTKHSLRILLLPLGSILILVLLALLFVYFYMTRMPGESFAGGLPSLNPQEQVLAQELEVDVNKLSMEIGSRGLSKMPQYDLARDYIAQALKQTGHSVRQETYLVDGQTSTNLVLDIPGTSRADEIILVGAHYDTVPSTPGADDNASAVAGLLALARRFAMQQNPRTLRLVAFANEEPPYFHKDAMGSLVYARAAKRAKDKIVAMVCLEMLGFFSDAPHSQHYPFPFSLFYPSTGNFIAFITNPDSRDLLHQTISVFRRHARIPSVGGAIFSFIPGIGFSDHWSFWQVGIPAIMITDTAFFRNPHYHEPTDTADTLDFQRMALVVAGLEPAIKALLNPSRR